MRLERLGVVGAGVMGSGIAAHWCAHGYDTILVDISKDKIDSVPPTPRLTKSTELDALDACDLILEAVYEDVEVKADVLAQLDYGAVLATNTSSLTVSALMHAVADRCRFLGLHYNNPPDVNPVVEVVPHGETAIAVTIACTGLVTRTGKRPILCKDRAGFALNRQSLPYINEAGRCFDEGLGSPASIDRVAKRCLGVGLGPFEVMNLVGTRVTASSIRNLAQHGPLYEPARCIQAKGEKNAAWEPGDDGGINSRDSKEVEERLLGAVFVSALEIVNDAITSAEDLDFICTEALGYPKGKGSVAMMRALPPEELARIVTVTCTRVGMSRPALNLPGA